MITLKRSLVVLICTYCIVICAPNTVVANSFDETAIRPLLLQGIEASYNMNFTTADSLFKAAEKLQPENPRPRMFSAMVWLWKYMFNKDRESFARFVSTSDSVIALAEKAEKTHPDSPVPNVVKGTMYAFRSVANVRAENFVKASWDSRVAYSSIKEVLKKHPKEYDAYLPMGLFHFTIGIMPKALQTMVNLSGLEGDKDKGIREITIASERSTYAKNDAKLILALLAVYYKNDYTQGVTLLKDMLKKYPNNVPMLYAMGNIESQLKKIEQAVPYFQRVLELSNKNFVAFTAYAQYRLGESYYRLGRYPEAKKAFQQFILLNFEKSFRAHGMYRLATIYELLGDRKQAEQGYKRTIQVLAVTAEDRYAIRKAKEMLEKSLTENDKLLIEFSNAVESLRFAQAEQLAPKVATQLQGDVAIEGMYYSGELQRLKKNYSAAEGFYSKVLAQRPERELWLKPWSYYRLSQVYSEQKKYPSAKAMVEQARAFFDYDFQEWLLFQLERDVTMLN